MNNKGFIANLLQIFLLKVFTIIFLIISFLFSTFNNIGLEIIKTEVDPIHINYGNKNLTYVDIEKKINEATAVYVTSKENIKSGYTSYINLDYLEKEYYIIHVTAIEDKKIECDGYGSYEKQKEEIKYKSYIKCGDYYTTEGFNSKYIQTKKY